MMNRSESARSFYEDNHENTSFDDYLEEELELDLLEDIAKQERISKRKLREARYYVSRYRVSARAALEMVA